MQHKISRELFRLISEVESSIANVLAHPDVTPEIKAKLYPLAIEMNTAPTCHLYGFRTIEEIRADHDTGDGERQLRRTA